MKRIVSILLLVMFVLTLGATSLAQQTPSVAAPTATPSPSDAAALMNPSQVAQVLGVAESDVLSILEAGDLKGKKIGTQWRVTRGAVNTYLQS